MVWYQNLYAGVSIAHKKEKVKQKICNDKRQSDIYVLALASNPKDLLDIIPSVELLQKAYPKDKLFVVGLAKGHIEARDLALEIVLEIHDRTGDFQVREYLLNKQISSSEKLSQGGALP